MLKLNEFVSGNGTREQTQEWLTNASPKDLEIAAQSGGTNDWPPRCMARAEIDKRRFESSRKIKWPVIVGIIIGGLALIATVVFGLLNALARYRSP
jgi:hypothetical protein